MEVKIISNELIKPSSQTPNHLKYYQLSFLDQISVPSFMSFILFYRIDSIFREQKLNQLKESLSRILTLYYPLAGRVSKGNDYVVCNDEGVPFLVAQANSTLSSVLEDVDSSELNKLVAFKNDSFTDMAAAIKITRFSCGGVSVSFGLSHKLGDASSIIMFLNSWASISRGESDVPIPLFHSAKLFPPKNISGFDPSTGVSKENLVLKRFIFNSSSILALQKRYASNGKLVSRVQAIAVFIWTRYMAAIKATKSDNKIYSIVHAVNLRPKMNSPDANQQFGNIYRIAMAIANMDSKDETYGIMTPMRDSIRNVDAKFVKNLQEGKSQHLDFMIEASRRFKKGEMVTFNFASLCKLPIYEVDFGFGKPIWVSTSCLAFKNLVMLFDTKEGDGIEAWVNLKEEDMVKFEKDKDLIENTEGFARSQILQPKL